MTENCRRQTGFLMEKAGNATTIEASLFDGLADFDGWLAQYYLDSPAALVRKLSQYPRGTVFTVRAPGDGETARATSTELAAWAAKQGFTVRPAQP